MYVIHIYGVITFLFIVIQAIFAYLAKDRHRGRNSLDTKQSDWSIKLSLKILDVYWVSGKCFPLRFLDGLFSTRQLMGLNVAN